jgi:hypothetical protein
VPETAEVYTIVYRRDPIGRDTNILNQPSREVLRDRHESSHQGRQETTDSVAPEVSPLRICDIAAVLTVDYHSYPRKTGRQYRIEGGPVTRVYDGGSEAPKEHDEPQERREVVPRPLSDRHNVDAGT